MPIIDKLRDVDFVGFGCHYRNCRKTGKPKPANWVMASLPKTEFMRRCVADCDRVLDSMSIEQLNTSKHYFDLGRTLLWRQIKYANRHIPGWNYYHYDSRCLDRDSNYVKIRNKRLLSSEDIDTKCKGESLFVPVYNTAPGFPADFLKLSKAEILNGDRLISKLFRYSLKD